MFSLNGGYFKFQKHIYSLYVPEFISFMEQIFSFMYNCSSQVKRIKLVSLCNVQIYFIFLTYPTFKLNISYKPWSPTGLVSKKLMVKLTKRHCLLKSMDVMHKYWSTVKNKDKKNDYSLQQEFALPEYLRCRLHSLTQYLTHCHNYIET